MILLDESVCRLKFLRAFSIKIAQGYGVVMILW